MLRAKKSVSFEKVFSLYNRNLIKRRFHSLRVSGLDEFNKRDFQIPLLIYANHSAWWDGLVAFEISRQAKLNSFVMMEERFLRKLFLFRLLGAFSVDRKNPRKATESLNYAVQILNENPLTSLWIFPQGKILHNDARPIYFYNGISRIIEKARKIQIIPLAIRYEFLNEFKPDIFVNIGKVQLIKADINFAPKKMTKYFAESLTIILEELKNKILTENFNEFEQII